MKHHHISSHRQKGMGVFALIVWVALGAGFILLSMKTIPVVAEYLSIKKIVGLAKNAGDASAIRYSFDQQAKANYVDHLTGAQLVIESGNGITNISYEYQRIIPLVGPVSLLFDFSGKELAR